MNNKILEIKNLYVSYRTDDAKIYAVNGLDISVNAGETVGLVGETGAGKTTTALSIMKLLPEKIGSVDEGEIWLCGENVIEIPEKKMRMLRGSKVSMIFQDPMTSLNPTQSVGQQIDEVIRLHNDNLSKADVIQRTCEILEMVGIPAGRRNEYPHQFSGGMKQRVMIAIALACETQLLLADEPTTALDVTIQAQVLQLITVLQKKLNTSMLLITHDLGVVAQICDKVGIMYAGELIEFGTVADIFCSEKNHHPYTVGLFGAIPNLENKEKRLNPIEGLMPDPADLPDGCKFHTRCPKCMHECTIVHPPKVVFGDHMISCLLFDSDKSLKENTNG